MDNAITAINTTLSSAALWGQFEKVAPFIAATTLFAFGFYLVKKVIRRPSKGKGGI